MPENIDKRINTIKSTINDLKINEYKVNNSGADNLIIIVNKDLVFKFPKQEVFYEKEKNFLDYIRPYISTNIPDTKIYKTGEQKFTCHKIINGTSYYELTNSEKSKIVDNLSDDLAKFFAELHSIKVKTDFPTNNQHYFLNLVEEKAIFENMEKQFVDDFLKTREYLINYNDKDNMCICHDDLHYGNIIVKDNRLSGIIDFGDIVVENYNTDFHQLCLRDFNAIFENNFSGLAKSTIEKYEKMSNRRVDMKFLNHRMKGKIYRTIAKSIIADDTPDDIMIKKILKINSFSLN